MEYHRRSIRLDGFNYSENGYYFVTICTQSRGNIFGEIKNEKIILNKNGLILEKWINQIPKHFDNVMVDIFQIMPDHMHMIFKIGINFNNENNLIKFENDNNLNKLWRDGDFINIGRGNRAPTGITLGKIVAYLKYQSTKEINNCRGGVSPPLTLKNNESVLENNQNNLFKSRVWQRNYYERIIRNEKEYLMIKEYIKDNPKNLGL